MNRRIHSTPAHGASRRAGPIRTLSVFILSHPFPQPPFRPGRTKDGHHWAPVLRRDVLSTNDYCITFGFGSSLAAHSPLLKSEKSTCPFHGIAFITNGALGV